MRTRNYFFTLVLCFAAFFSARATHNRAGEISYKRIPPFTKVVGGITVQNFRYLITVIKYTDSGPTIADRCVDTVYFGDNERGVAPRVNGPSGCNCGSMNNAAIGCGVIIIAESSYTVKQNIYTIEHTYAGAGSYLIRSFDPNRNQDVRNIPNSVNLPFYIESLLIINSFTGANSSPVFSFPPIDRACVGQCFEHNPGAYDPDKNDSLSYEITTSRGQNGQTVANYFYPETPATGGSFGIDARTGLLRWCVPIYQGEYNIAFIVKEWRKNTSGDYQLIGYILRDMQVIVGNCKNNDPPALQPPPDMCVEAGTYIQSNVQVTDPDAADTPFIEGGGAPFTLTPPFATLTNTIGSSPFTARFNWQTSCEHIRKQAYQVTLKVTDNGVPVKLVSFRTFNIRVVPPAVKNVTAVPVGSAIKVSWNLSTCSPAINPVTGYKIYRKNDCSVSTPDPCTTGVSAAEGFKLVGETDAGTTSFTDDNKGSGLVVGQNYSYLVVAVYNDGTESYASGKVCTELKRDVPIMLNVDVLSTSADSGTIFVRWTKPLVTAGNLDLNAYPGPYQFILNRRSNANTTYTTVFTSNKPNFYDLDTVFTDAGLNTFSQQFEYLIQFVSGTTIIGSSQTAESIFLTTVPADRKITLSWHSNTPWDNKKYSIWRREPTGSTFTEINSTADTTYTDSAHIANRYTYCYYVQSEGEYSAPGIPKPLLNKSQEACAKAVDLTLPCTPTLNVEADCPTGFVKVTWNNVRSICSDDVIKYILSYKPSVNDEYTSIETDTTYFVQDELTYISGCYIIQAVDSSGNLSPKSPNFCIDNCPEFELPNIFTPNGDGTNDHFMAIKVRQIKEIDLNVFDRWGNQVYHTSDPYFKWNGVSSLTKMPVSDGVLFYTCDVFEPRLKGILKRSIKGTVDLTR
jgi:gliding motility-associated-like protein